MASDADNGKTMVGCGCVCFVILLALGFSCVSVFSPWLTEHWRAGEAAQMAKQNAEAVAEAAAKKATEEAELEAKLRKFGKELVPDLQDAIDKYQEQLKQFAEQRAAFAQEMKKLGVDPDQRPAYRRKGEIIEKMKTDVEQLLAARKETYIKWQELNLLRDSDDTKKQREELLQSAQGAAKAAGVTFDRYMKQSEDTGGK
jgi:hypothetical protein